MNAKKLVEKLESYTITEEETSKEAFCNILEEIIDKEFEPIRQKLINLVIEFKEKYPDANEYSLPRDISRSIDALALCAGHLFHILNDDKRVLTKIRKALGYNE